MKRWVVYLCFVCSGAAGLILEIVWSKYLSLLLGNSIYGVSTVVAAFLGGLGIGAWAGGKISERAREPLVLYARLEIAVGALGLVSPLAYLAVRPMFAALYGATGGGSVAFLVMRFLILFCALLPPTVAMGASLPLLAAVFTRRGLAFSSSVGRLYAFNTAGAVLGVAAAGFLAIPLLGLWRTAALAALIDFAVAAIILRVRPERVPWTTTTAPERTMAQARQAQAGRASRQGPIEPGTREARGDAASPERITPEAARAGAAGPIAGAHGPATGRSFGTPAAPDLTTPDRARFAPVMARLIVPLFAVSGFTAILYEIAWTRILSVPLGGMVYALSAILALYLLGLALGSAAASHLLRAHDAPVLWFGVFQTALAGTVAAGCHVFGLIPDWQASLIVAAVGPGAEAAAGAAGGSAGGSLARLFVGEAGIAALVVFPPTLMLGALFPIAATIYQRARKDAGASVGAVYAANTFGSIAGSLLTGFVLIPAIGALRTILAAAAANLAMGLLGLLTSETSRRARLVAAAAVAVGAIAFVGLWSPSWPAQRMSIGFTRLLRSYRFGGAERGEKIAHDLVATSGTVEGLEKLRFYKEGRLATVAVLESPGRMALVVNGKPDATTGTGEDMMTQVMVGQIPLLLSPRAKDVCIVGYGSGVTTHAVLTHPVREALTLEIEQAVIDAAPYFKAGAFDPLRDPRSRVVVEDAGTFLRSTARTFDVIISEPSNPWIAGIGDLFTREFYDAASARLAPGGLFCQWLQCYEISPNTMWTIFRTLSSRFPAGQIFFFRPSNDLVIVASPGADLVLDADVMTRVFARKEVAEDLARVGVVSIPDLLRYYRGRLDRVSRIAGDGPINTDDNGWLEHRAPLDLVVPPRRGEPLGWSNEVAADLAKSLGPNPDRAAATLVAAAERAIAVTDRASARGFTVALGALGRPEAQALQPRLAELERTFETKQRAQEILNEASPLVLKASQNADIALGTRAAEMLADAGRLDPDSGEIAWRHGTALITAHRPEEAIRELRRALGLLPPSRHLPVRRDLVIASFFKRDFAECLLELDEMDRLRMGSPEARYWRARVYSEQGDKARAREEVARGLRDNPDNKRLLELNRQIQ